MSARKSTNLSALLKPLVLNDTPKDESPENAIDRLKMISIHMLQIKKEAQTSVC